MELNVLTYNDCEQIRLWRNEVFKYGIWRTSFLLTKEQQEDFYENDVNNRNSKNRWWAVWDEIEEQIFTSIGMVGLCNISLENRNAELTIIINPKLTRKGYGTKALLKLLDKGFNELNLENIYSEAYECNPNIEFWRKILEWTDVYQTMLPCRKYWNGKYYDSIYFNFFKKDFEHYVRSLQ